MFNHAKYQLIQRFLNSDLSELIDLQHHISIKETNVFGALYFIGKLSIDGKPLEGDFIFANNLKLKIRPCLESSGFLFAEQINSENNSIQKIKFKWQESEDLALDRHNTLLLDKVDLISPTNINIDLARTLDEVEVRFQVGSKYQLLVERHRDLQVMVPRSVAGIAPELTRLSATMISELGLRVTAENEKSYNDIDGKIDEARDRNVNFEPGGQYGNCLEFAMDVAQASEDPLTTFVIAACPNHIFNLVVDEDNKIYLVDHWHGNLICEFTADNFYQNSSLHGIYNFRIFNKASYQSQDGDDKNFGHLPCSDARAIAAEILVLDQIAEVAHLGFEDKHHEVILERVRNKISELNPNDAYYHEHAKELLGIAEHYCLPEELQDLMQELYIAKCDLNDFPREHHDYVILDLFCEGDMNSEQKLSEIKAQITDRGHIRASSKSAEEIDNFRS